MAFQIFGSDLGTVTSWVFHDAITQLKDGISRDAGSLMAALWSNVEESQVNLILCHRGQSQAATALKHTRSVGEQPRQPPTSTPVNHDSHSPLPL